MRQLQRWVTDPSTWSLIQLIASSTTQSSLYGTSYDWKRGSESVSGWYRKISSVMVS